jgi:hypothetical protein
MDAKNRTRQNIPYRRTVEVDRLFIDGDTVVKLTHIVRKLRTNAIEGLPRLRTPEDVIEWATEKFVTDYEEQHGGITVTVSGMAAVDTETEN